MRFSIIIPTYNRANLLSIALKSALNQSYEGSYEIIVVDDGSTDNTQEILKNWQKKELKLKIIFHEKNKGPAAARNTGIKNSKGEYLLFLDSDDELLPNTLKVFDEAIKKFPEGEVFIGRIIREDSKGRRKLAPVPVLTGDKMKDFLYFLKRKIPFSTGAFVVKRGIIEKISFPEESRLREDFFVYGYLICMCKCYALKDCVIIVKDHPLRLRKEYKLLLERSIKPVELLFKSLPKEFHIYYSFALSREYLSIFRSLYLIKEYKQAIQYYHKAIKIYPKNIFLFSYFQKYLKSLFKIFI